MPDFSAAIILGGCYCGCKIITLPWRAAAEQPTCANGPTISPPANPSKAFLPLSMQPGPWQWELHDGVIYGDYLSCRPNKHVWLRVHEHAQMGGGPVPLFAAFPGVCRASRQKFRRIAANRSESTAKRSEIDHIFRRLPQDVDAINITEIEPYDHPSIAEAATKCFTRALPISRAGIMIGTSNSPH